MSHLDEEVRNWARPWDTGAAAIPNRPAVKIDPDTMCDCGYRNRDHNAKGELLIAGYNSCRGFTPKVEETE